MKKITFPVSGKLVLIAKQNAQFMREQAAKARQDRDWHFASRLDLQARKWEQVARTGVQK